MECLEYRVGECLEYRVVERSDFKSIPCVQRSPVFVPHNKMILKYFHIFSSHFLP